MVTVFFFFKWDFLLPTVPASHLIYATLAALPLELMQTELHHIQTLTVMSEVFRRGMLEELQLDLDCVARIFPCLDPLLLFHRNLFRTLQERRQVSSHQENSQNYLIHQIGDILLQQVGGTNASTLMHDARFYTEIWRCASVFGWERGEDEAAVWRVLQSPHGGCTCFQRAPAAKQKTSKLCPSKFPELLF